MKKGALELWFSCVFITTLLLASCTPVVKEKEEPTIPSSTDTGSGLTVQDEATIYAKVITQLATIDNKLLGSNPNPEILYVVNKKINFDLESNWSIISEILQRDISEKLSDLSIEHVWIDFEERSHYSKKSGNAIITLGDISPQADESVQVWGSMFPANMVGGSLLYVLEKVDGEWDIIRTAGAGMF